MDIHILRPTSKGDLELYFSIFTEDAKQFLFDLLTSFRDDVRNLFDRRRERKLLYDTTDALPAFKNSAIREDKSWKISPLPPRLQCRNIDVGDVSPADLDKLTAALKADVDGIQVDFDDGHCPSWSNQLRGWSNIKRYVSGQLSGDHVSGGLGGDHCDQVPNLTAGPVLMLRPRAWNMTEYNVIVRGKKINILLIN